MNSDKFYFLLGKLAVSKDFKMEEAIGKQFYDDLGQLPHIEEVLTEARLKTYYNVMPTVDKLFQDHKMILKSKSIKFKQEKMDSIYKKSKIEEVPKNTSALSIPRDRCAFCIDAFTHLNLSNIGVEEAIEKGKITVPFNYSKLRTKEKVRDLLQKYISTELMVELKRVKSNDIFEGSSI